MATQVEVYPQYTNINETLSDVSTEGEDEMMSFYKTKFF